MAATPIQSAPATPAASGPGEISEQEAIDVARSHLASDGIVTRTMVGTLRDVAAALVHLPSGTVADDPDLDLDSQVWGIVFTQVYNICPDENQPCETRSGYVTVLINADTAEWLRSYGYAPNP
ncbi:MAG TPA: hypothetical protein VH371_09395 [Candidatus Limnocylindrales bacterium]|jgi:hypothetical protein